MNSNKIRTGGDAGDDKIRKEGIGLIYVSVYGLSNHL